MRRDRTARAAAMGPGAGPDRRQLLQRGMRAHEHLYRLLDADEPDLGANVEFFRGRITLQQLAAADSGPLDALSAERAMRMISGAEQVADAPSADLWFFGFVDMLLAQLTPVAREPLGGTAVQPPASRSAGPGDDRPRLGPDSRELAPAGGMATIRGPRGRATEARP